MTILTKPFNEEKLEKPNVPLVTDGPSPIPTAPLPSIHGDSDTESITFHRRRMSSATTFFLFLSAVAVMCMGILGGVAIYRLYAPTNDRLRFHGYYGIPYDNLAFANTRSELMKLNENLGNSYWEIRNAIPDTSNPFNLDNGFFQEELELDLSDEQSYAKIDVPDFKDGRRGRFMHDFKANQSAIIDTDAARCFIMPLDRETVLPPRSLLDLLNKMWSGYYDIDTDRVKKNMRVVTPELTNLSQLSPKIADECIDKRVYLLEKYVSGVFKREALKNSGKFAQFSGNKIVEIDLVNIQEVDELEKRLTQ